jgi:membrane fusion protein, multidrug efflux system
MGEIISMPQLKTSKLNSMKAKLLPAYTKHILFLSALWMLVSCTQKETPPPPPLQVPVFELKTEAVPIYKDFVGQTFGVKDIAIRARVDGVLEGMYFREGFMVNKSELLYRIDDRPLLAKEAARMSEVAQANTMLAKAESDLKRIRPLAETNAVSQRDLDAAVAQFEAAKSGVEAAKANLRAAQIELGYAKIKAPITGIIGMSHAKVGDYVGREPNPVILNTVSDIDTILVRFFLAENELLHLMRREESAIYKQKAREEGVKLLLSDNSLFDQKGRINFLDRSVDPSTGSILIQASFPNPDKLIRPGFFSTIRILYDYVEGALLVPKRSVRELQTIYQVFVVNAENKVEIRQIEVAHTVGQQYVVKSGLKAGERLVLDGIEKVRPGMTVLPEVKDPNQSTKN